MSVRRLVALLVFSFLVFPVHSLRAQEVTAGARVDSTNYLVGDPIGVHVEIRHPTGMSVQPLFGDTLGGFHLIRKSSLNPVSETRLEGMYVFARFDSGSAVLPPLDFLFSLKGDTASQTVSTNPVIVTVRTVNVDTTKAIKDVKPQLSLSLTLAEIAMYAGIILAVVAIAIFLYRYLKKKQDKKAGRVYVSPPRPAHTIAFEQLALLKEQKLWQQGLIKEYYSEATEIIRRYFENRFKFMALEQTTDEIMAALKRQRQGEAVLEETERILRMADLAKFAKFRPDIADHEQTMTDAFAIVEKTKAVEVRPVSTEEEKAAHVGS